MACCPNQRKPLCWYITLLKKHVPSSPPRFSTLRFKSASRLRSSDHAVWPARTSNHRSSRKNHAFHLALPKLFGRRRSGQCNDGRRGITRVFATEIDERATQIRHQYFPLNCLTSFLGNPSSETIKQLALVSEDDERLA